jgi:hypothetical protein
MIRVTFIILITFSIITGSCSGRKNKLDRSNLIPENELISLITDIYITNGLMTLPNIRQMSNNLDSIGSYKAVIEKHGYTKEMMDITMKFYFINNTKKLIKIYDQVLGKLSEMESRYDKEIAVMQSRGANTWTGKDNYLYPDLTGTESTDFDLKTGIKGTYILTFNITLYPDDQSFSPRMIAYTYNPAGNDNPERHYLPTLNYLKDGEPHTYSFTVTVDDPALRLKGSLYCSDNNPADPGIHLRIEKISFMHSSAAL